jgi:hypothetical protein
LWHVEVGDLAATRGGATAGAAAAARRLANPDPDPDQVKAELEQLARSLDRQRPGAAASLREGLELTLTVTRLGVGGKLLQTVASTNPMESMIEIVRDHACRVKRWSSGRWSDVCPKSLTSRDCRHSAARAEPLP